jgi:hypothetical protein
LTDNENNPEWDANTKHFLKEWFSGLMVSIENLDKEIRPKVLEMTGRACAQAHAVDLFRKTWETAKSIDDFIPAINKAMGIEIYKKIDDKTISAVYSKCYCPLVNIGLVNSPILCNCSPNWILENFEAILDKPITVTTKNTVLRGADSCNFIISME